MTKRLIKFLFVFLLYLNACSDNEENEVKQPPHVGETISIGSGTPELVLKWDQNSNYKVDISAFGNNFIFRNSSSVIIQVFPVGVQSSVWYESSYQTIEKNGNSVVCMAEISTTEGSLFEVTDTYQVNNKVNTLQLTRNIKVIKKGGNDHAFNSYVILQDKNKQDHLSYDFFIPSILYKNQSNLSNTSIGSDFSHDWILAREERMGLPFAMMRHKALDYTVSIMDYNLDPETFKGEFGAGHFVNSEMKFASLGFYLGEEQVSLAYCYPGSEGERTYSDGTSYREKRWARRSHPVNTEVQHSYTLQFQFNECNDFPEALEMHWKAVFDRYNPKPLEINSEDVIEHGLEVLNQYWQVNNGAPGFPFSVHLPSGIVNETSYSMGFVGMQISCGYYLYRYGVETGNDEYKSKGEQIIDFWANNSANPDGMPRVWWDVSPWNLFRDYNDLRNMQGGLEAMIWAWGSAEKHFPGTKSNWLDYCVNAANWLLERQYPDGSWDKAFNNAGFPIDFGKLLTSNLIRFFTYMYIGTGDERYKAAALKAGEFCFKEIHEPYRYVGSVIDNPYIIDRESGQKVIEAFLCLFDLTDDEKWLVGAKQAAFYTATYMYAWNIPVENGDSPPEWPNDKTSIGLTIIATGHSGADCGLSYNSFEYFRLYVLTEDEYFLRISELLEKNTKQTMNYDGSLGYAYRGLQTEAIRLVTPRGYGVKLWLPWVTASALDPLFKLKDAYNSFDLMNIAVKPMSELKTMDRDYARKHGILN